ncbi:MAG: helix-turn-helix domain-containing protein [Christensenella sp.]
MININELYNIMFQDYPDVLNVTQLSKLLSISTKLTSELLKENKIQYTKIGREYRIAKIHVIQYLNIVSEENRQHCI